MLKIEKREKILTIDDDIDTLFLEKILLEREGFEVFTSRSAEAGLEMISQISDLSLILCDMEMDKMNGVEFIRHLKNQCRGTLKKTPVILVTGHDKLPVNQAAGYIKKGAGLTDFVSKVRGFLNESAQLA